MSPWLWVSGCSLAVLTWTWFGYPTAVWLASRLVAERPRVEPDRWPTVTAILATRDDSAAVAARVDDFFRADYPPELLRVVVGVDSANAHRLDEIRRACPQAAVAVVAASSSGGKAAGLNAAVRSATGDVLIFSDVQQRFAPDAIRVLVASLVSDERRAAVGGALQLPGVVLVLRAPVALR
jgi:poly-beta-1,6-N-acetyl-D-glucosamine synthase